jgi:inner membrane protein
MDNVCHTLVGAVLAEAGMKRRTALGTATLMIGANFPDIDAVAAFSEHGLAWRRGVTHGLPAMVALPFVLAAAMMLWHRLRRRPDDEHGLHPGQLLMLAAVSIATHPVLDWMNTYGMRWFMPMSDTWWFGDALFIVDPWILVALGAGVWLSRRRARRAGYDPVSLVRPARIALAAVVVYIVLMVGLTERARTLVRRDLALRGVEYTSLMVDPVPLRSFARRVVYEADGRYEVRDFSWSPPHASSLRYSIPLNSSNPLSRRAASAPAGAEFLRWSRLPFYVVDSASNPAVVHIGDARYTRDAIGSWASVRVVLR